MDHGLDRHRLDTVVAGGRRSPALPARSPTGRPARAPSARKAPTAGYESKFDAQRPATQIMVGTPLCSAPAHAAHASTAGSTPLAFRAGDGALSVAGMTVGGGADLGARAARRPDRAGDHRLRPRLDNALWVYTGARPARAAGHRSAAC